MLSLDANTTESDLRHIVWVLGLAAHFGIRVLREIKENLTIEHTILIQVKNLGPATLLGLLDLRLLLGLLLLTMLLFGELILERPGHLLHLKLVFAHLLFKLSLQLSFGLRVETSTASTTTSLELGLKLGVLRLKLADHLSLWVLIDDRLVLNLLRAISITESGERFFVVSVAGTDGTDHDSR